MYWKWAVGVKLKKNPIKINRFYYVKNKIDNGAFFWNSENEWKCSPQIEWTIEIIEMVSEETQFRSFISVLIAKTVLWLFENHLFNFCMDLLQIWNKLFEHSRRNEIIFPTAGSYFMSMCRHENLANRPCNEIIFSFSV